MSAQLGAAGVDIGAMETAVEEGLEPEEAVETVLADAEDETAE